MGSPIIRVHLVHGTWARGLLGRRSAWTEPGQEVYARLQTLLPQGTPIETFTWTGSNSVAAREQAARQLSNHLEMSLDAHPDDEHVVIAHSHGGTISSAAVADPRLDGRIRSVICLATPFTYVVGASLRRIQAGIAAVASVGYAAYWTAMLLLFPWLPEFLGHGVFIGLVALKSLGAFFLVAARARLAYEKEVHRDPMGPQKTPVFVLRGSRDEATLALSTAQVVNWAFYVFAISQEVTMPRVRKPSTFLLYFASYAASTVLGVALAVRAQGWALLRVDPEISIPLGLFVYAPAIVGMLYLVGCLALGLAAGFWGIGRWMTSAVEVETAPPNTACRIYVFSQLRLTGMRHGLYEDEAVLKMVAALTTQP